jgi:hypothetical protein
MPWIMGMGFAANLSPAGMATAMPSLMGHVMFGAVLGYLYYRLGRAPQPQGHPATGHAG